jgi:Na+/melibiose symporter-like transporter
MSIVMMMMAPLSARFVEFVGTKAIVASGLLFVAGSLLLMEFLNAHSSEWAVVLVLMPFAVGMANVMAPATESIMGSLPREKAGVGSAINDTTRQVGGAIGVALMGSLLSSRYITHVNAGFAGSHAPAPVLDIVRSNIQAAVAVGHGQGVPPNALPALRPFQSQILSVSTDAYVAGLHLALPVAAAIILVATIGVMVWLPARAAPEPQPELAMAGNGAGAVPSSDGVVSVGSAVSDGHADVPTNGNGGRPDPESQPPAEEPVGRPAFDR